MVEHSDYDAIIVAQAEAGEALNHFHTQLDRIVESKGRIKLAGEIHDSKRGLLAAYGINPDYANELTDLGSGPAFTNPEAVQLVETALAQRILKETALFRKNPNRQGFIRSFGAIVALSELRLLGPIGLTQSRDLQHKGEIQTIGIQKQQIDASVSIYSLHSTEADSGQGKSIDIQMAAVTRALLAQDQVHYVVRDPQAKRRDSAQLAKLTEPLGISVKILKERSSGQYEAKRLQQLVVAHTILSHGDDSRRYRNQRDRIRRETETVGNRLKLRQAKQDLMPKAPSDIPQIAVGSGSDFIFRHLREENPELWNSPHVFMGDEADLLVTKSSPHIIEKPGINVLATYLPEWIGLSLTNAICNTMLTKGKIQISEGRYQFIDDNALRLYERFFSKTLKRIQTTGELPTEIFDILEKRLAESLLSLEKEFRPTPSYIHQALPSLIMQYASMIDPESAFDASYAWMRAKQLQEGAQFRYDSEKTILIDQDTGHALPTHQFQDLHDVAVDVLGGICSLRARTSDIAASTGFYHYIDTVYGKKRAAIVAAVISHIAPEIKYFLGKPVVTSERWVGSPIPIPDIIPQKDVTEALQQLQQIRAIYHGSILVITNNDKEIELLQGNMQDAAVVTSKTSLQDEENIFKKAGEAGQVTIVTQRGGRMIDISTTQESDAQGGLLVIGWGALHSYTVLKQAMNRTRRAGHPGSVMWIAYKHGGHAALDNNPHILRHPELAKQLDDLEAGQPIPYEYSVIEAIHQRQNEQECSQRLRVYLDDTVRKGLKKDLMTHMNEVLRDNTVFITTAEYNVRILEKIFGPTVNAFARELQQSITFSHSLGTYTQFIQALQRSALLQASYSENLIRTLDASIRSVRTEAGYSLTASRETKALIKKGLPFEKTVLESRQAVIEPTGFIILPNQKLGKMHRVRIHDRFDISLPELPNHLFTLQQINHWPLMPDGHVGAMTREFRLRFVRLDTSSTHEMVDFEKEFSVKYPIGRSSPSEKRGRKQERQLRRLWHEYLRNANVDEDAWVKIVAFLQKEKVF